MTEYRYKGSHAGEVSVGDNRVPVAPGDFVNLEQSDVDNVDNAWLFDGDLLMSEKDYPKNDSKTAAPAKASGGDS